MSTTSDSDGRPTRSGRRGRAASGRTSRRRIDVDAPIEARLPASTCHRQTWVAHGEWEAWVDVGMADLIVACWRLGIATSHSCEDVGEWFAATDRRGWAADHPGWAYIGMPAESAEVLLPAVRADRDVDGLTDHIEWAARVMGVGDDGWIWDQAGPGSYQFPYFYVHLPQGDIPEAALRLGSAASGMTGGDAR